jgi:hypothetical protein
MKKLIEKFHEAYPLVQRIDAIDRELQSYHLQVQLISEGKTDVEFTFRFKTDLPPTKEDIYDEHEFIKKEFQLGGRGHGNMDDFHKMVLEAHGLSPEDIKARRSTKGGFFIALEIVPSPEPSTTVKSDKMRMLKDSTAIRILGEVITDLVRERKEIEVRLEAMGL